ncbi:hypothetical protein C8J56DRAFT_931149 [Mycena floridula]|nr:hypothetical protein C8J56DRAFT_931149 [Mycena floridula]
MANVQFPDIKPPATAETLGNIANPLNSDVVYGDFRDDLVRDGFAVVPAITAEKAATYVDAAHSWLESFNLGYKRDDPATWKVENIPSAFKGGLFVGYGVPHEQFLWDIRQEPGVIDTFARIWGTDKLLVSFDGVNISVPGILPPGHDGLKPWPHVDQSPNRTWFHCIQGIVNLLPNGPDDGGLMIMRGTRPLFAELFETFKKDMPEGGWKYRDTYHFNQEHMKWFESKGCTWHKVTANPGDVILWDSRTCHYGAFPTSNNFRVATYVCYKPAHLIPPDFLELKIKAMNEMSQTTHDPVVFAVRTAAPFQGLPPFEGAVDRAWENKKGPAKPPVLSSVGRKLAGLESY